MPHFLQMLILDVSVAGVEKDTRVSVTKKTPQLLQKKRPTTPKHKQEKKEPLKGFSALQPPGPLSLEVINSSLHCTAVWSRWGVGSEASLGRYHFKFGTSVSEPISGHFLQLIDQRVAATRNSKTQRVSNGCLYNSLSFFSIIINTEKTAG